MELERGGEKDSDAFFPQKEKVFFGRKIFEFVFPLLFLEVIEGKRGRWGSRRPNLSSSAKKRGWGRESQTLLFLLYLPQHPRALKRNKFRMQILFRTAAALHFPFPPGFALLNCVRGGNRGLGFLPFPLLISLLRRRRRRKATISALSLFLLLCSFNAPFLVFRWKKGGERERKRERVSSSSFGSKKKGRLDLLWLAGKKS